MRWLPWLLGGLLAALLLARGLAAYALRPGSAGSHGAQPALRDDVTTILAHPAAGPFLYVGSRRGVFASEDGGAQWRRLWSARGVTIHDFAVTPTTPPFLYMATTRGLYRSDDRGRTWQRRAHSQGGGSPEVLAVAVSPKDPQIMVIGTPHGVAVSRDGGMTWHPSGAGMPATAVRALLIHPDHPSRWYAMTASGLYWSEDRGAGWVRALVSSSASDEGIVAEDLDETETSALVDELEVALLPAIGSIALDPAHPLWLYAGTDRGVWRSEDAGRRWRPLPSVGFGDLEIRYLLIVPDDPDHLYAATSAGLFIFSHAWQAWRPMTGGLPTADIRRLAWDPTQRVLYAATDAGLFRVPLPVRPAPVAALPTTLSHEPTIADVHAAAIRYAEVQPEKIRHWRALARYRAFIPSFTLGIDRDTDTTVASSTSGGKTTFTVGPEDRSVGLDFGFTWDLGDFLWSTDQTSIDVRSRLMVQLRGDILDDATRLYYERRRLQMESALTPLRDPALQAERQLRIDELTAQLDALTGGAFSQHLSTSSSTVQSEGRQ